MWNQRNSCLHGELKGDNVFFLNCMAALHVEYHEAISSLAFVIQCQRNWIPLGAGNLKIIGEGGILVDHAWQH